MWKLLAGMAIALAMTIGSVAVAKDVHVRGYTRKDGTYVAPYIRSAPDKSKANNYGPSKSPSERLAPATRDADKDGTPNYLDKDDNNNRIPDDRDPNQYRPKADKSVQSLSNFEVRGGDVTNVVRVICFFLAVTFSGQAFAWGPTGHKYVGAIADTLLNAHAAQQVHQILGYNLQTASVWADCVRSVHRSPDGKIYSFVKDRYTAPCVAFFDDPEKGRMEDYVRRNWETCSHRPDHGCDEDYHFTDVDIEHGRYDRAYFGTSSHDIVSAINAAVAVLQDKPAPAPFSIKDKKEAILMLAHFVGDLHQPLHVGAIYLSPTGQEVDPDKPGIDGDAAQTRGGNSIKYGSSELHGEWDAIPRKLGTMPTEDIITKARAVSIPSAPPATIAAVWATDTVKAAQEAFEGISFAGNGPHQWTATLATEAPTL